MEKGNLYEAWWVCMMDLKKIKEEVEDYDGDEIIESMHLRLKRIKKIVMPYGCDDEGE